jgi:hypothetical protein
MAKNLIISILAVISVGTVISRANAAGLKKAKPLRDGFVLAGVDGKLTSADSNKLSQCLYISPDRWFFEFDSDVSDDKGRIRAGESLEVLPSTTLEKMDADAQKRSDASYRLWGNVTKYKNSNFIFPIYFLPISKIKDPIRPQESPTSPPQKAEITINEPNDVLAIPQEITARLKTKRIVRTEQLQEGLELKADWIIADRTAFLSDQPDGGVTLVLDALGRNVPRVSFRLLPCEALQYAQRKQSAEADPLRFKIAGILTQYKGEHYLLLERAIRVYSHQNFPR